jgi:LuxR family maltose regulon positive regulatory protein
VDERRLESGLPVTYPNEQLLVAFSRVRMAEGRLAESLKILGRVGEELESAGRSGRLIEVWNLSALALCQQGRADEALNVLQKSLTLGEPEGYRQIFLDEGQPMIELLTQLRRSGLAPQLGAYVNRLLESRAA